MSRTYKITKLEETVRDRYSFLLPEDSPLVPSFEEPRFFTSKENRVETVILSLDGRKLDIIEDNTNYSVLGGGSKSSTSIREITLFPEQDAISRGFESGDVELVYSFYNNLFSNSREIPKFFIQEISPDRTEVVALGVSLPDNTISKKVREYKTRFEDSLNFQELLFRFEDSSVISITNIDTINFDDQIGIKIKLYQPLPPDRQQKTIFSVEEPLSDGVIFRIEEEVDIEDLVELTTPLKGPNFNIKVADQESETSEFLSLSDILSNGDESLQGKILRRIRENSISLGIDYEKPEEFIHFSSYLERIKVYEYKKGLLAELEGKLGNLSGVQKNRTQKEIDGIKANFDHLEEYLDEKQPDLQELKDLAQLYDNGNQDRLINSIPDYLREDSRNISYLLFVDMVGHMYDNLWIYIKSIEKRYNTDNRLDIGLSQDLLVEALTSFGIKLKSNKESVENLFKYLSGVEEVPGTIGDIEVDLEKIVEGTDLEDTQPFSKKQYVQEVYKRIFHNIPYLLKTKGTEPGLRALINCFGIPSSLLEVKVKNRSGDVNNVSTTSSVDRINIPSGSIEGNTLIPGASILEPVKLQETENYVEIGFSISDLLNDIIPSGSLQDVDQVLGDPRNKYKKEYKELKDKAKEVLGLNQTINIKAFSRLLEFYNNSLFKNIVDFIDGTTQVSTGLIIKSHSLNRNKNPEALLSSPSSNKNNPEEQNIQDIQYLFDIIFNGNIDVGSVDGGDGGAIGDRSTGFIENITLPKGGFSPNYTIQSGENPREYPRYNGEFKGSNVQASTGELNTKNTFKKASSFII